MTKLIHLVFSLFLVCFIASAQSSGSLERSGSRSLGVAGRTGTDKMIDPKMGTATISNPNYKNYSDDSLNDFSQQMKERDWGSEDTAWKRAREADNKQSYERYMAIYPNGAHMAEATTRLIEANIAEALNSAHNDLPNITHIESDDASLTSTITFENNTGLQLTIYYSGSDIRSIVIPPGGKSKITINNGNYKLAASVPPSHIRPYAGQTVFTGGSYEMGFWIVTR